jgi:hypothetical protein
MTDASRPIGLSTQGPPETVLDDEPAALRDALAAAVQAGPGTGRTEAAVVVAANPRSSLAWAVLGDLSSTTIDAYAAYRVGYHRGLDTLRAGGWRGSGYVRWQHPGNRGFLRCLAGLERTAAAIGEHDEQERCALFLRQLDPSWPPADLAGGAGGATPQAGG